MIIINNKFVSEEKARLPINSDLLLGYGVFETLRTYDDKKIFRVKDHLDRLFDSAEKIGLSIEYSKKEIAEMLKKIIEKSLYKNQRVKIVVIPEKVLVISSKINNDNSMYDGVKCMSLFCERSIPEIKSISYLPSFLAHRRAEEKGYFEAILLSKKKGVFEGAYSNIF